MNPLWYAFFVGLGLLLSLIGWLVKDKLKTIEKRLEAVESKIEIVHQTDGKVTTLLAILQDKRHDESNSS